MKTPLLALALVVAAVSAPAADLGIGYSFLSAKDAADESFALHGIQTTLTLRADSRLGLDLDAAQHWGSNSDANASVTTFLAGPRLSFGGTSTRFAVRAVGGIVRTSESISVFSVDISDTANDFGGAVGGRVDLRADKKWGVRIGAELLMTFGDDTSTDPRATVGVVLHPGR